MEHRLAAIGGYGKADKDNLFLYRMENGMPHRCIASVCAGEHPSYLLFGQDDILYAVNERNLATSGKKGLVKTFSVPALEERSCISTEGEDPCFLLLDPSGNFLLATNYTSGSVAIFRLDETHVPEELVQLVRFEGSGPDKDRQEGPHPHSILFDQARKVCYVADLGMDCLHVLAWDPGKTRPATAIRDIALPAGSGPRMMRFFPDVNTLLAVGELDNTISAVDLETGRCTKCCLTVEGNAKGSAAAHLERKGDLLFVSTRGEDTIMVRKGKENRWYRSLGNCPRFFAIEGTRLLVANQDSDSIVSYRIGDDGTLAGGTVILQVPKPTCIDFRSS
jgi:6-phosphogluconolactonase